MENKLSLRQIKTSLRLSPGAVQKVCSNAETIKLDRPAIELLDDQQLTRHPNRSYSYPQLFKNYKNNELRFYEIKMINFIIKYVANFQVKQ